MATEVIEIPHDALESETLEALIEAYVLREGTDYGEYEVSLVRKVAQIKSQLQDKQLCILFDQDSETCNLVTREELKQFLS